MQNDLEEVLSSYEQLITSINDNIPFISEPISFLGIEFTIAEVVLPVVFLILINLLGNLVRSFLINKVLGKYIEDRKTILSIGNTTKYIILFFGLLMALTAIGIDKDSSLNFALSKTGENPLMFFELLRVIFLLILLIFLSGKLKIIFVKQIMSRYSDDLGVNQSIGTIFQYTAVLIGGLIIIQSTIELGSLNVLAGALGVGIGFGLQNIANNFISGLIILFERPIKVGDRIEVGQVTGDIVRISSRATTVSTNDNISIIIPNAEFISKPVINWSHSGRNIRFHVPVGVAYKEDPAHIKSILLGIATKHPDVLQTPAPDVLFTEYGDNSLNFDLLVWTSTYINKPTVLKSQLYYLIFEKFKEHNVEIPFPQRDIHIKTGNVVSQK
ncbi:mechanosensitive ion channel family protein [Roseivirga seohaensis]|uniref:mechanosensitive ion channel family protein n=1 Tax=Roseivirga seohaensis TaxID=1914963 RepID=UPI000B25E7DD|nr:mechanosensitive ion channel domain-containing protein [Roseivirga seohaensis]